MHGVFTEDRFELLAVDRVTIADQRLSWGRRAETDVWIERDVKGARFVRRTTVNGFAGPTTAEIHAEECYLLRDRFTDRYHFLELATRGYSLQDESFSGASTFVCDDAIFVRRWLAARFRAKGAGGSPNGETSSVIE